MCFFRVTIFFLAAGGLSSERCQNETIDAVVQGAQVATERAVQWLLDMAKQYNADSNELQSVLKYWISGLHSGRIPAVFLDKAIITHQWQEVRVEIAQLINGLQCRLPYIANASSESLKAFQRWMYGILAVEDAYLALKKSSSQIVAKMAELTYESYSLSNCPERKVAFRDVVVRSDFDQMDSVQKQTFPFFTRSDLYPYKTRMEGEECATVSVADYAQKIACLFATLFRQPCNFDNMAWLDLLYNGVFLELLLHISDVGEGISYVYEQKVRQAVEDVNKTRSKRKPHTQPWSAKAVMEDLFALNMKEAFEGVRLVGAQRFITADKVEPVDYVMLLACFVWEHATRESLYYLLGPSAADSAILLNALIAQRISAPANKVLIPYYSYVCEALSVPIDIFVERVLNASWLVGDQGDHEASIAACSENQLVEALGDLGFEDAWALSYAYIELSINEIAAACEDLAEQNGDIDSMVHDAIFCFVSSKSGSFLTYAMQSLLSSLPGRPPAKEKVFKIELEKRLISLLKKTPQGDELKKGLEDILWEAVTESFSFFNKTVPPERQALCSKKDIQLSNQAVLYAWARVRFPQLLPHFEKVLNVKYDAVDKEGVYEVQVLKARVI